MVLVSEVATHADSFYFLLIVYSPDLLRYCFGNSERRSSIWKDDSSNVWCLSNEEVCQQ